jgi:hypothetical protein
LEQHYLCTHRFLQLAVGGTRFPASWTRSEPDWH